MRLKKWVRVVLTIILMIIGLKMYYASNDFSMHNKLELALLCWCGILIVIPYALNRLWQ